MSKEARSGRDKKRAAMMKDLGIERTVQRCPVCYRVISCDSTKSKYKHICKA